MADQEYKDFVDRYKRVKEVVESLEKCKFCPEDAPPVQVQKILAEFRCDWDKVDKFVLMANGIANVYEANDKEKNNNKPPNHEDGTKTSSTDAAEALDKATPLQEDGTEISSTALGGGHNNKPRLHEEDTEASFNDIAEERNKNTPSHEGSTGGISSTPISAPHSSDTASTPKPSLHINSETSHASFSDKDPSAILVAPFPNKGKRDRADEEPDLLQQPKKKRTLDSSLWDAMQMHHLGLIPRLEFEFLDDRSNPEKAAIHRRLWSAILSMHALLQLLTLVVVRRRSSCFRQRFDTQTTLESLEKNISNLKESETSNAILLRCSEHEWSEALQSFGGRRTEKESALIDQIVGKNFDNKVARKSRQKEFSRRHKWTAMIDTQRKPLLFLIPLHRALHGISNKVCKDITDAGIRNFHALLDTREHELYRSQIETATPFHDFYFGQEEFEFEIESNPIAMGHLLTEIERQGTKGFLADTNNPFYNENPSTIRDWLKVKPYPTMNRLDFDWQRPVSWPADALPTWVHANTPCFMCGIPGNCRCSPFNTASIQLTLNESRQYSVKARAGEPGVVAIEKSRVFGEIIGRFVPLRAQLDRGEQMFEIYFNRQDIQPYNACILRVTPDYGNWTRHLKMALNHREGNAEFILGPRKGRMGCFVMTCRDVYDGEEILLRPVAPRTYTGFDHYGRYPGAGMA